MRSDFFLRALKMFCEYDMLHGWLCRFFFIAIATAEIFPKYFIQPLRVKFIQLSKSENISLATFILPVTTHNRSWNLETDIIIDKASTIIVA